MKEQIIKYRGVKTGIIIGVLEGDGKENPYIVVDYVLLRRNDGTFITHGKVVPLSETERAFIGKDYEPDL